MKNKKRKVLPLLLAGVLLLSAGAYGTRAYFTDSAEQEVGIKLTLGDLDIKSESSVVWNYTPEFTDTINKYDINDQLTYNNGSTTKSVTFDEDESIYPLDSKITVNNVRPGDAFEREFTFTNDGSLALKVQINEADFVGPAPFEVTIDKNSDGEILGDGFVLNPEDTVIYTIRISVSGSVIETDIDEYVVDYFGKFLTVSATQPNDN